MSEKIEETVSVIDLLDSALMQKQEEEIAAGKKFGFPLRPSSSGKCAKALAYELNEFEGLASYPPERKNPNIIRLLELGHDIERSILNVMRRSGIFDIKYSQQVVTFTRIEETGRLIEGSLDLVLVMGEHLKMIGDVKSKGVKYSRGFNSNWEEDDEKYARLTTLTKLGPSSYYADDVEAFLEEARDETIYSNITQLNGYARSSFIVERGIEYAFILQYNKSNSMLREIRFKTSQALADKVNEKFKRVATAIYTGKGPESIERERALGSMSCSFCRFAANCWPEIDTKKEFFKTLPPKEWARDTDRLGELGDQLEAAYQEFANLEKNKKPLDNAEQKLLELMLTAKESQSVKKFKFSDGAIYELKFLKSPRPHYEVRRGKV